LFAIVTDDPYFRRQNLVVPANPLVRSD